MKCPQCQQSELEHKCWDYLEGWGESEYEDKCKCGYSLHFAYGSFTEIRNGKEYMYSYNDTEDLASGKKDIEEFLVPHQNAPAL